MASVESDKGRINYKLAPFQSEYTYALTQLWRTSMEGAIGISSIHDFDTQASYLVEVLAHEYQIIVALSSEGPVGFMVFNEYEIDQLYIHINHQKQGIGRSLIEKAKALAFEKLGSQASLSLRTFHVNQGARAFYHALGFVPSPGNKDNEEGLLDLVFTWSA